MEWKWQLNHLDQCFSDWSSWEHLGGALLKKGVLLSGAIFKNLTFSIKTYKEILEKRENWHDFLW